jgi:hypothetical protein
MEDQDFDLAAALFRADASDARALAEALAAKLSAVLPDRTTVKRRSAGLRFREKRVEQVEVGLGDEIFALSLAGAGPEATRSKKVGGVVIKRQTLPLEDWLRALSGALSAEAERSQSARVALERLLEL